MPASNEQHTRPENNSQAYSGIDGQIRLACCQRGAIGVIAYDKLYKYEPQLRELADDSDDFIQAIALFHLVGTWGRIDLLDTILHIALHHPSLFSRDEIYAALGNLIAYHEIIDIEITDRALTTLVAALLNETDSTQRRVQSVSATLYSYSKKGEKHEENNTDALFCCPLYDDVGSLPEALLLAALFVQLHTVLVEHLLRLVERYPEMVG